MLREFLIWWAQQLRGLIPGDLARDDPLNDALVMETADAAGEDPGRISLIRRRGRQENLLGSFDLDATEAGAIRRAAGARPRPRATILRLPASAVLEREVTLPLAAERMPQNVLEYEMGRLTPFSAAELFWSWQIARRDRVRGLLHVRLCLAPKAALEPLTNALARAGLAPTVLEAASDGPARRIWVENGGRAGRTWRRRVLAIAAGGCALLAVAAIVLPFILQASAAASVTDEIARLRPAVSRAEALRSQIARAAAGGDAISAERARTGSVLEVLAKLTDLLPDDTYLTDLALRERKLEINGESAAAARLIGRLSADPALHDPVFAAPVTHLGSGTKEIFAIRADVPG